MPFALLLFSINTGFLILFSVIRAQNTYGHEDEQVKEI
jgi:hypothetical protein